MLASPFSVVVFLLVEHESKINKAASDRNATNMKDTTFFIFSHLLY